MVRNAVPDAPFDLFANTIINILRHILFYKKNVAKNLHYKTQKKFGVETNMHYFCHTKNLSQQTKAENIFGSKSEV